MPLYTTASTVCKGQKREMGCRLRTTCAVGYNHRDIDPRVRIRGIYNACTADTFEDGRHLWGLVRDARALKVATSVSKQSWKQTRSALLLAHRASGVFRARMRWDFSELSFSSSSKVKHFGIRKMFRGQTLAEFNESGDHHRDAAMDIWFQVIHGRKRMLSQPIWESPKQAAEWEATDSATCPDSLRAQLLSQKHRARWEDSCSGHLRGIQIASGQRALQVS